MGDLRGNTMKSVKRLALVSALLLLVPISTASAQGVKRVLLQGYGAFVPVRGGLLVNDGWAAGGLLGVATFPQVWLMGSITYYWLDGAADIPEWNNLGYFGMLGYDIVPPGLNGNMIIFAGAGGVTFEPNVEPVVSETYFALNGGLKVVYDFSPHVAGTVDLTVAVAFSEEEFVGGQTWFFPLGVGLAFRF